MGIKKEYKMLDKAIMAIKRIADDILGEDLPKNIEQTVKRLVTQINTEINKEKEEGKSRSEVANQLMVELVNYIDEKSSKITKQDLKKLLSPAAKKLLNEI